MFISSEQSSSFVIPGTTNGKLYPSSPKGDQSIAVVTMDGSYPEVGYSYNDVCTETLYMLSGEFQLEYDGVTYTLTPGDLFYVLPEHKYRIVGTGSACVFISPSWDSNQNHILID